jgi:hypothetical protein
MIFEVRAIHFSIVLCIVTSIIGEHSTQGQQSIASSRFGASTSSSALTTGADVASRRAASGETPTWGAGKGSFGYSAQPVGVWYVGTTLSATLGNTHKLTQAHNSPTYTLLPSLAFAPGSFSAKPSGAHESAETFAAHLSYSFLNQPSGGVAESSGSAARSFGKKHAVVGSRGWVTFHGRSPSKRQTPPLSSLASNMTQRAGGKESASSFHLHSALGTQQSWQGAR